MSYSLELDNIAACANAREEQLRTDVAGIVSRLWGMDFYPRHLPQVRFEDNLMTQRSGMAWRGQARNIAGSQIVDVETVFIHPGQIDMAAQTMDGKDIKLEEAARDLAVREMIKGLNMSPQYVIEKLAQPNR